MFATVERYCLEMSCTSCSTSGHSSGASLRVTNNRRAIRKSLVCERETINRGSLEMKASEFSSSIGISDLESGPYCSTVCSIGDRSDIRLALHCSSDLIPSKHLEAFGSLQGVLTDWNYHNKNVLWRNTGRIHPWWRSKIATRLV